MIPSLVSLLHWFAFLMRDDVGCTQSSSLSFPVAVSSFVLFDNRRVMADTLEFGIIPHGLAGADCQCFWFWAGSYFKMFCDSDFFVVALHPVWWIGKSRKWLSFGEKAPEIKGCHRVDKVTVALFGDRISFEKSITIAVVLHLWTWKMKLNSRRKRLFFQREREIPLESFDIYYILKLKAATARRLDWKYVQQNHTNKFIQPSSLI